MAIGRGIEQGGNTGHLKEQELVDEMVARRNRIQEIKQQQKRHLKVRLLPWQDQSLGTHRLKAASLLDQA